MPLTLGTRLGPYEITGPLGKGGMGEVYRAKDTKLGRDVAIKVLPNSLARDPDRLARFEREAKVLASLNHPNIATIYSLEEFADGKAIAMELVEGDTLKSPQPINTAVNYAKQIADALEAAHEKGVTHRDLKPANIMVTPSGLVKVLDFGLAAVARPTAPTGDDSPTLTMGMTEAGMIMGTAAYMAPEQAVGSPVDRRADIWSFGVVLWQMLTGKNLFSGDTTAHILAGVINSPIDFNRLPESTPEPVRDLIERCLDRDVKTRLQVISEARIALQRPVKRSAAVAVVPPPPVRPPYAAWALAAVGLLAAGALAFLHFRETPPTLAVQRFALLLPESAAAHSFAISPDGRLVVISATISGKQQLWLQPLDAPQAQAMPFTEDGIYPFWSPDSRFIGFFAQGKLRKVAASGGPALTLCDAPNGRGGDWNGDDVILFAPTTSGSSLQKVAAAGGVPVDVLKTKGDLRFPRFLPGGKQFLYLARGAAEKAGIFLGSLDGKPTDGSADRRILADDSSVALAPGNPGFLLFVRQNTLLAQPFDAVTGQLAGEVFPVVDGVALSNGATYAPATVSDNGVLLYSGGNKLGLAQLAWYDRSGQELTPLGRIPSFGTPALSPDEKFAAFMRGTGILNLWLRDLVRGTETRFTSSAAVDATPVWSPTGDRIVFSSNRTDGVYQLFQKSATGSGQDEVLFTNPNTKLPYHWSRDGRFIVYGEIDPKTKGDLWVLPMEGADKERKPVPFLQTEFDELMAQFSPDGQWMAYTSDQSGKREVYVRPFPRAEGQWTISLAGGEQPRWRGDGKELFFEAADGKMMAVPVKASAGPKPTFEAGTPVALFDAHMAHNSTRVPLDYDVAADGKRFLITTTAGGEKAAPPLSVVVNWNAAGK